jgi:hypothetical protein
MTVDTTGDYDFQSAQEYDGFLFLYVDDFNPEDQLTNGVAGDDDGDGGIGTSNFIATCETGRTYFIVTTGFGNDDCGPFANTISGPGEITLTDPPTCLVLFVDNLVAGQTATFTVEGGTPGERGAIVWGSDGPATILEDFAGWCARFDFEVQLKGRKIRIAGTGVFDGDGVFSSQRQIKDGLGGFGVMFQAAERNTCPSICMSNVVDAVVAD